MTDELKCQIAIRNREIERLRAEVERLAQYRGKLLAENSRLLTAFFDHERKVKMLRKALKPFAEAASMVADGFPDHDIMPMQLGQCRDARAAIAETENG